MLKRTAGLILSTFMLFSFIWLHCAAPEAPDTPSKTSIEAIVKTPYGMVFDYSIEVSIDDEIVIGAAMYLPENIDSVKIEISEKGEITHSRTFYNFKEEYNDTVWLPCTFSKTGVKTITIISYSTIDLPIVTSSVTIVDDSGTPEVLKWLFDTIPYNMNTNSQIALDLSKFVSGSVTDNTIFKLRSGSPEKDNLGVLTYEYAASVGDVGTHYVNITVANEEGGDSDLLVIRLTVEDIEKDTISPQISLITPPDTNITLDDDSYSIALLCSDASGVASVEAALGEHSTAAEYIDGFYQITLSGLDDLDVSEIIITAVDSATPANSGEKTIHILDADEAFTVTYLASGEAVEGEVPVDNRLYTTGAKVAVAGNTGGLEKENNTFIGWNTVDDGSGEAYAGGEYFTLNGQRRLPTPFHTMGMAVLEEKHLQMVTTMLKERRSQ